MKTDRELVEGHIINYKLPDGKSVTYTPFFFEGMFVGVSLKEHTFPLTEHHSDLKKRSTDEFKRYIAEQRGLEDEEAS